MKKYLSNHVYIQSFTKYKRQYKETGHYAYKNIYEFMEHNMIE